MLDAPVRRALAPTLDRAARRLAAWGVRPGVLTAAGWLAGVGACAAAALRVWPLALALWLGNRLLDGLDRPVARVASPTERRAQPGGDERSLRFAGGLAEGTETVVVYVLFCLLPQQAAGIAWGFAVAVGITAVQRVVGGLRLLREPDAAARGDRSAHP